MQHERKNKALPKLPATHQTQTLPAIEVHGDQQTQQIDSTSIREAPPGLILEMPSGETRF